MTKALLGARLGPSELALLDEVRRLRARVAELEAALADHDVAGDAGRRAFTPPDADGDDVDARAGMVVGHDVAPPMAD